MKTPKLALPAADGSYESASAGELKEPVPWMDPSVGSKMTTYWNVFVALWPGLSVTVTPTVKTPALTYVCVAWQVPLPLVSVTEPALVWPSPQVSAQVWVSAVSTSVKLALMVAAEPAIRAVVGPVMLDITGGVFTLTWQSEMVPAPP